MAISLNSSHLRGPNSMGVAGPPLTFACWFRTASYQNATLVSLCDQFDDLNYYQLGIRPEGAVVGVARESAWQPVYTSSNYSLNQWTHAAVVFLSDTQWYSVINGVAGPIGTFPSTVPANLDTLAIGRLVRPTLLPEFTGEVAEVAVWAEPLPETSISALAKGFSPLAIGGHLGTLRFYRDYLRSGYDPAKGPTLIPVGTTNWTTHLKVRHPTNGLFWELEARERVYRSDRGSIAIEGAQAGATSLPGAAILGEVS